MTLSTKDLWVSDAWEKSLLALANEAWHAVAPAQRHLKPDAALLAQAYNYCEAITAGYSRSFHMASGLLKRPARRAVRALYAFCRTTDNIVDEGGADAAGELEAWRERALSWHPPKNDLVALAWADTRASYRLPQRYAEQLIDGVARDLQQSRYETFEELSTYCYGVASTVGLMSMHIVGYQREEAVRYAIKLGVALQLTNILRDIGEDWGRGRLYLPIQELAAFKLSEAHIANEVMDHRWRHFMRFQIARARHIYQEAWPGLGLLEQDGRFAISAAATFYRAILDDIEAHDYDVFHRRAHIGRWGKIRRLPAVWWQSRS